MQLWSMMLMYSVMQKYTVKHDGMCTFNSGVCLPGQRGYVVGAGGTDILTQPSTSHQV